MVEPTVPLHLVPSERVGQRLRAHRTARGLTQAKLAAQLGVTQQTIAAWERGDRPGPEHVAPLARCLDVAENDLARDLEREASAKALNAGNPGAVSDPVILITQALAERTRSGSPLTTDEVSLFRDLIAYYARQSTHPAS